MGINAVPGAARFSEPVIFTVAPWSGGFSEPRGFIATPRSSRFSEPMGFIATPRSGRFSEPMGSALEARAYFLLGGKKKVAKEEAAPGSEAPLGGFPALLGGLGGSLNSPPMGAQTTRADFPQAPCVARLLSRGPRAAGLKQSVVFHSRSGLERPIQPTRSQSPDALPPMEDAEQRRASGGLRVALSEPQASLATRPEARVAQGTGQSPASTLGSPFLW